MVVSITASQQESSWYEFTVWSLHVLPVYVWVLFRYSGFLPLSKSMHVRLIGDSKLSLGVSLSVHGCLSVSGPVMDWQPLRDLTWIKQI